MSVYIDFSYFKENDFIEFYELNVKYDKKTLIKLANIENKLNNNYYDRQLVTNKQIECINNELKITNKGTYLKDNSKEIVDYLMTMDNFLEIINEDLYLFANYTSEIDIYNQKELVENLKLFDITYLPEGEYKITMKVNCKYSSEYASFLYEPDDLVNINYEVLNKKIKKI